MQTSPPSFKLRAGQLYNAWVKYPADRKALISFPSGPPIFVTGTYRSGSTWAGKMLAIRGVWHVHEPFNPNQGLWPEEFSYASPDKSNPRADKLISSILKGENRHCLNIERSHDPLMPMRLFHPVFNRALIKDPVACLMTEYLTKRFGFQSLIIFRHPCGFASSMESLKWPRAKFLRQFLNDPDLMKDHLSAHQQIMERHCAEDNLETSAVLHGVLNRVLWNAVLRNTGTYALFEALCADPVKEFEQLFKRFNLPYNSSVQEYHKELCFTNQSEAHHPHSVKRNSAAMADGWKSKLNRDQIRRVRAIWQEFEIPLYQEEAAWA